MRLALIGTGLIGGSAAWAMKNAAVFDEVTACDLSLINAQCAVRMGIADRATTSVAEALKDADAAMVAVPVLAIPKVFAAMAPHLRAGMPVTDVGSTRCSVIEGARKGLGSFFADYAPVHPIAGGEMPGIEYADAGIFKDKKAISTPDEGMGEAARVFWEDAWSACGSRIERMSPEEHDEIFAAVSHLPHVLAYALVDAMAKTANASKKFSLVGAGFKDFTRIAASSPAMWRDICLANREAILRSLALFEREIHEIYGMIERSEADAVSEVFERASQARRTVGMREPLIKKE
ncbi:MAG: prephenate dehydrogenase/arogenate dehydrogenase family protein [Duodenibacillus sp.]|nr:prephenate dehydrogenase/arogenate dehydrogenase family protein [Duodenibacillus sp.]